MSRARIFMAAIAAAVVVPAVLVAPMGGTPTHLATPSAAATSVPSHVMTATQGDFDSPNPFPAAGLPWLTWALIGHRPSRAEQFHDAGVKVMYYTFETRQSSITEMWSQVQGKGDSVFALDCAGHRLRSAQNTTYLMNVDSPDLESAYRSTYIDGIVDKHPIDAVFYDGAGNLWDLVDEQTGQHDVPCVDGHPADPADWVTNHVARAIARLPVPVFFNGLAFWHTESDSPADQLELAKLPNVIGGRQEECFLNENRITGVHTWLAASNTALAMGRLGKLMICQPKDPKTDPSSDLGVSHRLFAYASFLLTYDPKTSIYWYAGPTRTANLYPEIQVVALDPTQDARNVSELGHGDGVYGREYRNCYFDGKRMGSCAVAVDIQRRGGSAPFPFPSYVGNANAQTLTLSGSDIVDGGTAAVNGGAAPSSLDPGTGVIVFDTSR